MGPCSPRLLSPGPPFPSGFCPVDLPVSKHRPEWYFINSSFSLKLPAWTVFIDAETLHLVPLLTVAILSSSP